MRLRRQKVFHVFKMSVLILACCIFTSSHVLAGPREDDDYNCSDNLGCNWYAPNETCGDTANTGLAGDTPGSQSGIWNSGLQPPYILEQFAIETLKAVAQKKGFQPEDTVTEEHVIALVAFMYGEGGDIANTSSIFNPLNSGIKIAELINGKPANNGTQSFVSFDAGVEATARTIVGSFQSRLADTLVKRGSTANEFMYALTYYDKYPGNKFWAEASVQPNADSYYRQRLVLVQQVRNRYESIASLIIGTIELEQFKNLTDRSKLQFHPAGSSTGGGTDAISADAAFDCGSNPGGGAVAGDIIKTTLGLAWPDRKPNYYPKSGNGRAESTPAYQQAMPQYNGSSGLMEYTDCGVFTSTVIRASKADPDYPKRGTWVQLDYVRREKDKWQIIPNPQSTIDLQPGDIMLTDVSNTGGHTFMYTGPYTSPDGKPANSASASWTDFVPMAEFWNKNSAAQHFVAVRAIKK